MNLPAPHNINKVTRALAIGPLVIWGVWELVLLWLRMKLGPEVRLVSGEMKHLAFQHLTALAYFVPGLAAHFFCTWWRPTWEGAASAFLAVLWWSVGVVFLMADILDPNRTYWPIETQWLRYPPVVALIGALLAIVCFPQHSEWVPGAFRR